MSADEIKVENTIPVLPVADRRVSERFYIQALGFRKDWGDDEATGAGSVSRNGHAIMLLGVGARPSVGSTVWIGISDVATLHAALRARGVKVIQPPTNQPWALEMRVEDPDGNVLWFGSEPVEGTPFGQPPCGS